MNITDNFLGNKRISEFPCELNKNRKEKNEEIYKQKLKEKKKQKKKDKKANTTKDNNNKEYLLKLLNEESKKNKNNNLKLEYQPIEEVTKLKKNEINPEFENVFYLFDKKIENQNKKIESLTKEKQINNTKEKTQNEKKENSDDSSSENNEKLIQDESRKKRKKMLKEQGQSLLADLKSKAQYPEVVEPWDTNGNDPELLFIYNNFIIIIIIK